MPVARVGLPITFRPTVESGFIKVTVTGSSTGYGGTSQPVFVPTSFAVQHAVANLAREYDLRDAAMIYNFGSDVFAGEVRVDYVTSGNGFLLQYLQKDQSNDWLLACNWFAISV